jgi:hypothetical protein
MWSRSSFNAVRYRQLPVDWSEEEPKVVASTSTARPWIIVSLIAVAVSAIVVTAALVWTPYRPVDRSVVALFSQIDGQRTSHHIENHGLTFKVPSKEIKFTPERSYFDGSPWKPDIPRE